MVTVSVSLRVREGEREMEGGKRASEAGPSSAGSSSAGVVGGEERREKQKEMGEKPSEGCYVGVGGGEEDDDEGTKFHGVGAGFVPGPLVSLKEQIEKDKVGFFFFLSSTSAIPFQSNLRDTWD